MEPFVATALYKIDDRPVLVSGSILGKDGYSAGEVIISRSSIFGLPIVITLVSCQPNDRTPVFLDGLDQIEDDHLNKALFNINDN
jgi:hypothetical protein